MALPLKKKLRSMVLIGIGGFSAFSAFCLYKEDPKFYKQYVLPCIKLMDAEKAHKLGVFVNKYQLLPKSSFVDPDALKVKVFNKEFPNPVGIAAGFDKNGEAIIGLKKLGFGFIEIGSVTPLPQEGNEKPRVFRLSEDKAVINRYGFNSEGHEAVLDRIVPIKENPQCDCILGVNLGKNKTSTDSTRDYVLGIQKFGAVADYLVINISSPNTPGLRNLQAKNDLENLLKNVLEARDTLPNNCRPPILLKLAPDLTLKERKEISEVIKKKHCKIDGLIISNTTIQRPEYLSTKNGDSNEIGGLSGAPLKEMSTQMIADMYNLTDRKIPIIGVGGISNGQDAYEKIKAGAVLVQVYTAMIYEGPTIATNIKKELLILLEKDGFRNISEAVGKGT